MQDVHIEGPGGVIYSPASAHSREMAKWEMRPKADGSVTQEMIDAARRAGQHKGAFDHQEFPKAMVKFEQTPNGIKLTDTQSADSEIAQRNLESRGYRARADDAYALVETKNFEVAEAAANRAFQDRRMSETARREAEAADNATARHLGEIPRERIVKRVRRTNAQIAADAAKG